jgi:hypothetical protein
MTKDRGIPYGTMMRPSLPFYMTDQKTQLDLISHEDSLRKTLFKNENSVEFASKRREALLRQSAALALSDRSEIEQNRKQAKELVK